MLNPIAATVIILVICLILLVLIPILDSSKKFGKYISLRYTLVVVVVSMVLGCVLNFSHLMESSRNIVLLGGLIIVGLFIVLRSLEKFKLGQKVIDVEVHKGDIGASAKIENKPKATKSKDN